jgi:hypothetical protein
MHSPDQFLQFQEITMATSTPNGQFNKPSDSLKGFVGNFCSQAPVHLTEADDAPRVAMT